MLVFGVDVPLVELILVFAIITFILLAEALVIIVLLINQLNKTKNLSELIQKSSETFFSEKKADLEPISRVRNTKSQK